MSWPKGDPLAMAQPYVRPGSTVIDVGAADGSGAIQFAKWVGPTGHVHAIEPHPLYVDNGQSLCAQYPQVTWSQVAAWDTAGLSIPLYTPGTDLSQSSCFSGAMIRESDGDALVEHRVMTTRLDVYDAHDVSVVTIDAQGAECHVLDGATQLLSHVPCWIVECWPKGLAAAGRSAHELLTILQRFQRAGLTVYLADNEPVMENTFLAWVNRETLKPKFVNLLALRP